MPGMPGRWLDWAIDYLSNVFIAMPAA